MTTTMNTTAPKTNLAAKSALAKLMAAENITVEVNPSVPTASFDLEQRRLTLPLWDIDGDAYDMLVGHEVSHALYSPQTGKELQDGCAKIDSKRPMLAKNYLNIVEDARIERLIKLDYPGLRKSFAAGYREFMRRDLFSIANRKVEDLPLIDRINLQYKIGWLIEVPFTKEELALVQRVATTRTWDEVVDLSKEIYELAKQQKKDEKEEEKEEEKGQQGEEGEKGEGEPQEGSEGEGEPQEGSEGEEEGEEEGKKKKKKKGKKTDEDSDEDSDEEGDEKGQGKKSDSDEDSDEEADGNEGGDSDEDSDEEADEEADGKGTPEDGEDDDDGTNAEADEGDGEEDGKNGKDGANSGGDSDEDDAPADSTTDKTLQEGLDKLVKKTDAKIVYADLPTLPENFVIPFARVEKAYDEAVSKITSGGGGQAVTERVYAAWKNKNAADVLALATEFERRKAADAHKRTVTGDTGALDPARLFEYKTNDDIFLRSSTVMDGKNHGLVLMLDMSGSMTMQMLDTVIQLVNLTAFARRVSIPFKVYGFIDHVPAMADGQPATWGMKNKDHWKALQTNGSGTTKTRLLTLLESGTTQLRYQKAAAALLTWAASMRQTYNNKAVDDYSKALNALSNYDVHYGIFGKFDEQGFHLNGTPTNEALMALLTLAPNFKKKHNLQVVNTIILTDGQAGDYPLTAHGHAGNYGNRGATITIVRDPQTRREYKTWNTTKSSGQDYYSDLGAEEQQGLLVKMLKDRTGSKVININLVVGVKGANSQLMSATGMDPYSTPKVGEKNLGQEAFWVAKKQFTKDGWVALKNTQGFDEVIFLNTANATENEFDFDSVTVDATTKQGDRDLHKAFVKSLVSRKGNRPLMARIAELVSKNL